jgi:hypothetical protein
MLIGSINYAEFIHQFHHSDCFDSKFFHLVVSYKIVSFICYKPVFIHNHNQMKTVTLALFEYQEMTFTFFKQIILLFGMNGEVFPVFFSLPSNVSSRASVLARDVACCGSWSL